MGTIPSTQTPKIFRPASLVVSFGITLVALGIGVIEAHVFDVFHSGFSGSDESAHFVNSYFFWSFLTSGQFNDPLGYAQEFYTAYPRLSIGHWPPLYYLFIGLLFFVLPPMPETAMALNLALSIAPVFFVAHLVQQFASWRWALFAGVAYAAMPLTVKSTWFFMLDQPVALICLASAICWQAYAQSPKYVLALLYGALAAAAILVKGNGWLLGLFPVFHILIGRHWHLLRVLPTYAGAILAIVVVLPWYWITAKISAEPFRFEFGGEYALQALTFNISMLTDNLGFMGFGFALLGMILSFILARQDSPERRLAVTSISLILATLALQSLVPVGLADRYMAPALPFAVILAVIGMVLLTRMPWTRHHPILRHALSIAAAMILLIPGGSLLLRESPQRNVRMADAAELVLNSARPYIIVIDGSVGAEGAFIAEVLVRTHNRRMFVVRGSKLLSYSDFMGNDYRPFVKTSDQVMTVLADLGAAAIVIERHTGGRYYPHNDLLIEYLNSDASTYRKAGSFEHLNRDGITHVYLAAEPVAPNIDIVRSINFPSRKPSL